MTDPAYGGYYQSPPVNHQTLVWRDKSPIYDYGGDSAYDLQRTSLHGLAPARSIAAPSVSISLIEDYTRSIAAPSVSISNKIEDYTRSIAAPSVSISLIDD